MNQISMYNHKKAIVHNLHITLFELQAKQFYPKGIEAKTDIDITSIEKQKEREL